MNPAFERHIGIVYSGAETPSSSLKGLRDAAVRVGSLPTTIARSLARPLRSGSNIVGMLFLILVLLLKSL